MKKVHIAVAISISIFPLGSLLADELVSLDDPPKVAVKPDRKPAPPASAAAAAGGLESLDSLDDTTAPPGGAPSDTAGGDSEVTLDVGGEDSFTPYTFSRTPAWAFLPIGALTLVGLHLMGVPKRKSKRKIDQARRFFRGISGEGTNSSILVPPSPKGDKK